MAYFAGLIGLSKTALFYQTQLCALIFLMGYLGSILTKSQASLLLSTSNL